MLKHILSLFLLTVLFLASPGQELNGFEEATDKHIQVKGTQVFIIPPMDFAPSPTFKGFQDPSDPTSMIMVVDVPGPFAGVTQGFTAEMMEPRGMKLIDKQEISVGDFEGYLINIEQAANGLTFSKLILVYGNEQNTTLINGVFLKDSVEKGTAISESIKTTFVNSSLEVDPRKELSYEVDETVGNLQLFRVMGNSIIFNRDGKAPTESKDKAVLIVDKSFLKQDIPNPKAFCLKRMGQYPSAYKLVGNSDLEEVSLDGLMGYALTAKNLDKEGEEMYQIIIFDTQDRLYYLFVANYLAESKEAKKDLKAVIETFTRKK